MAQILAMIVNERKDDWDVQLPHVAFDLNDSASAATGSAPVEVHTNRLLRSHIIIIERPYVHGRQSLERDHIELSPYCS